MERPTNYVQIPPSVRFDKNLRFSERLLYGEIKALTNEKGACWASNGYFAELYDVTPQAISKWINHLKERGYIFVEITYKPGSKEVDSRIITLNKEFDKGVSTNDLYPPKQMIKENNILPKQKIENTPSNGCSQNKPWTRDIRSKARPLSEVKPKGRDLIELYGIRCEVDPLPELDRMKPLCPPSEGWQRVYRGNMKSAENEDIVLKLS